MPDTSDKSSVLARRSRRSYLQHKPNICIYAKYFLFTAFHTSVLHKDDYLQKNENERFSNVLLVTLW
jgi:hypothetical protein